MAANKTNESARARKLVAGINQHLAGANITLDGVPYTASALALLVESFADLFDSAQATRSAYREKVKDYRAKAPALRVIVSAFVGYVRVTFGNSPQALNDFGIPPKKAKTPSTAGQKVLAVEKRAATRVARHTVGPRKKLAIKGTVAQPATSGSASPVPEVAGGPAPGTTSAAPAPAPAGAVPAPANGAANGSQVHGPVTP